MTFATPAALLLLLALPAAAVIGWPRRRFQRARGWASLLLRLLILTLITLALAGASLVRAGDQLAVAFLLDRSDSIDEAARQAQEAYVAEALAAMPPGDRAAVIAFGANALVDQPMSAATELAPVRSTPITGNTDLEEAISLAVALFPEGAARRVVVLSDGAQTVGDASAAARQAAAHGVQIDVVPLTRAPGPEAQLVAVDAPEQVTSGQQFDVALTVEANQDTDATLTILARGAVQAEQRVRLREGVNSYVIPLQADTAGFLDLQVRVTPVDTSSDTYYQNNALGAFTRVLGPPRLLVVRTDPAESAALVEALRSAGYTVEETAAGGLPSSPAALESYDAVILANVPASALSTGRMEALASFVRDLGGGLVVSGGPDSFGPGGYFMTPLEDALPVESQIKDQQRLPQLTILYVIDRSGSMSMLGPSRVENIELAKEAIIRSIDFLQPTDRAGVVSFDTEGYWIAEIQPVLNRLGLQSLVASLRAGGGTDILAGLRLAGEALRQDSAPRKHIILLTDGGAPEAGLAALARELNEGADITTSVIAIGAGAAPFLDDMAKAGGGNYHAVDLVETIPSIFTQETVLATRAYIIEGEFTPVAGQPTPILDGITAVPPLAGYVATTPRQTAQVGLRASGPYFDPILAQWQYGLGRSVAFTGDAGARWGSAWLNWDEYARFWDQAVQWTLIGGNSSGIESFISREGELAVLNVDARADDGTFLNGLDLTARVLPPGGAAYDVPVRQTAPGRYTGSFAPGQDGAYLVTLVGRSADASVQETIGWVQNYSPEYSLASRASGGALAEVAALTGGRDLTAAPADAFAHTLEARPAVHPISFELLLAALLLVPLDVAVRRLLITRSDLARARAAAFPQRTAPHAVSEQMQSLKEAKARTRQTLDQEAAAAPSAPAARPASPAPTVSAATTPVATPEGSNLAGELLKRRKPKDG